MVEPMLDMLALADGGYPTRTYAENAWIFRQEDAGDQMFVVRAGVVHIIGNGSVLEVIGPNGLFGEMALVDGAPRGASAKAAAPTVVIAIDRGSFLKLIGSEPEFALEVMRAMAARIRQLTEVI